MILLYIYMKGWYIMEKKINLVPFSYWILLIIM